MRKYLILMLILALITISLPSKLLNDLFTFSNPFVAKAQVYTKVQGYAQQGGQKVYTQGLTSDTSVQKSYPLATITVFNAGTVTIATIYSDSSGTPQANPFTASSTGYWSFYAQAGARFDIRFSGGGIVTPFTLGDFRAPLSSPIVASVRDDFGAVGDGKVRQTATMSASSTTLTCSDCSFSSSDIGKKIDVNGAGAAQQLMGTVVTRNSATSITLDSRASFTTTNQTLIIGGRTVNDAATTAGSAIVTSITASFQSYDVARRVRVTNAGASNLVTTISGFTNSTTVTLAASATGVVSSKQVVFGTDDTTAFQNALNSSANTLYVPDPPGDCYFFSTRTLTSAIGTIYSALQVTSSNKTFLGDGPNSSKLYFSSTVLSDSTTYTQGITILPGVSNIQLKDIALHGTNKDGQQTPFGIAGDGLYIDVVGPIFNISSINCYFNNFWVIGWHAPGSQIPPAATIEQITIINCQANYNAADGFNPNPYTDLVMTNCRAYYNGTGGIETISRDASFTGNILKHNLSVGVAVGGNADPFTNDNISFIANIAENNTDGFIFGGNIVALVATANIARFNYNSGIIVHDEAVSTLTNRIRVVDNEVLSNGGVGSSAPFGINIAGTRNTVISDNDVFDEGIAGFQQKAGVVASNTTNLSLLRNRISGHVIQDYSLSNCPSTNFVNEIPAATTFLGGTSTFVYPSSTISVLTINNEERLTPTVVADTSLNPFTPTNIRLVYCVLTANRVFSPFNGIDGQLLTLIFVQDGTGNRTLSYAGMLGGVNISAGQAAGKANIQTFIFRTGIGWMAYTTAIQNQ
jgi:hypothetical protein